MSTILTIFSATLALITLALLFWPHWGLMANWRRSRHSTSRIMIEDALKHLYDLEYKNLPCTLQSISGILAISGDAAAKLLSRLEKLGLIKSKDDAFQLTAEGRNYALRMVRIHRLWESYLAQETGLNEKEWHPQAERLEHRMTDAEAEALADFMGNPSFDPHGDPIPTAAGGLPPRKGQSLTDLKVGELARVSHVEDEPAVIYEQLIAQGLRPGVQIQLLKKTPQRLHFVADGEENTLAPVVASNVTVEPLPAHEKMQGPFESLSSLEIHEKGEVLAISKACRGQQRRRLMDLGVVPGTVISAEMRSASGDPTAYNIRGAVIALRDEQANMIHIKRIKEGVENDPAKNK
ncbi:MAG: iron dependent repressor, metal binding and dimerization domain protein [bacterium]